MTVETSNVVEISVRDPDGEPRAADGCGVLRAIGEALAILDAIDQGGLLEAVPEGDADRARHQTAVTLLAVLERQLREAVGNPEHLISDECGCNGKHCSPRYS